VWLPRESHRAHGCGPVRAKAVEEVGEQVRATDCGQGAMPYPDFRELSVANVGSNLRPRAATRDLRASVRPFTIFVLFCGMPPPTQNTCHTVHTACSCGWLLLLFLAVLLMLLLGHGPFHNTMSLCLLSRCLPPLLPPAATNHHLQLTSLGGIKVETRNAYVGKGAVGDTAPYQEARANHLQRQLGSTGNHIRVFPAVAEFKDTEPNVTHMLTITVVNRSDHVKIIRFVPPKLKQFALHQIPSMPVAPGLEVSADLEYFSQVDGDYEDEIIVLCESDRIKVPIYAYAPRAELFFDSYCLFGAVPPSSTNIRYVDVVNRGKKAADFEFLREDTHAFIVEPMVGRLGQDGSDDCFIRVKVTFSPGEDLGLQRAICQVTVNGEIIGEPLDLSALVARYVKTYVEY
jgi:hypothetical protein